MGINDLKGKNQVQNMSTTTNKIHVLRNGYSKLPEKQEPGELSYCHANCTCTLVTGSANVIVDTMTPWDRDAIISGLADHGLTPDDINYVVSTHGHSDHIGNNNLFLKAKHIVGFCVSYKDKYFLHPFDKGIPYSIAPGIQVIPTPGHTSDDVSVVVDTEDMGRVYIAGDIFEREEDIESPEIWRSEGGSIDPEKQELIRWQILTDADYVVPGHGPMFRVRETVRSTAKQNLPADCTKLPWGK